MRAGIIQFLKLHPFILNVFWTIARWLLSAVNHVVPTKDRTMVFVSFGGRVFDDSPKAIYDEVCSRHEFDDWELIWTFVDPDSFDIPRGRKVRIDTPQFFWALLTAKVWVSNSGIDRGIGIHTKKSIIKVETWHAYPTKKVCGEENTMPFGGGRRTSRRIDRDTIRCAQGEYDLEIFMRIFNAPSEAFLLCDLPRNDILLRYTLEDIARFRQKLHVPDGKKVILYMPTWREFQMDEHNETYLAPPMDLEKWKAELGREYVLLVRAHYAVMKDMDLRDDDFLRNMTHYPVLSELYAVADILISDYSSAFIDYSIGGGAMFCFAYDYEEYVEKRGLYMDWEEFLPCPIDRDEDTLIKHILEMDAEQCTMRTDQFRKKVAPHAGHASQCVVNEIQKRLKV